ncbi:CTC-interacting domain 12 [Perilla frutescens var. frutescens]|nr:CTC-interacting domain 12 [Perilla frutescens var. frutescens]
MMLMKLQSDVRRSKNRNHEMLSEFNPMAQEIVAPPSWNMRRKRNVGGNVAAANAIHSNVFAKNNIGRRERKNGYEQPLVEVHGKKRLSSRTKVAQRQDSIRRTVYVSDIDHHITEEELAALFLGCGQVVDCRVCGDPRSILRFAFVEFTDENGARAALTLSGTMLGYYPIKVSPSKTAIAPVNPTFLPQTLDEREACERTVYVTNIHKKVSQEDVLRFFETVCGKVYRIKQLGDKHHSSHIAFVEFALAESATAALNCSGVVLGSLPIRSVFHI